MIRLPPAPNSHAQEKRKSPLEAPLTLLCWGQRGLACAPPPYVCAQKSGCPQPPQSYQSGLSPSAKLTSATSGVAALLATATKVVICAEPQDTVACLNIASRTYVCSNHDCLRAGMPTLAIQFTAHLSMCPGFCEAWTLQEPHTVYF